MPPINPCKSHRVTAPDSQAVIHGVVRFSPIKFLWLSGMGAGALIGGLLMFSWAAFGLFIITTGLVLLLGHSLGSHRKLIHNSFQCPKWLEYFLVYCGVQVGLAGPLGLLRQHELRDFAQRQPDCHDYLRHGQPFWKDAWWQLACDLKMDVPPVIDIEQRIAGDRFYRFLERTWMLQQIPWALLFWYWGGWGFVFWGVCARVTAGVVGHWFIGYFAHNDGVTHIEVRGAAVQGRNIRWVSLLTMGEGWHNNHHAYPGSARLGLFPGEWDPGWWVLCALRKLGLVWDLTLPDDLPQRSELTGSDELGQMQLSEQWVQATAPSPAGLNMLQLGWCWMRLRRKQSITVLAVTWPQSLMSAHMLSRFIGEDMELHPSHQSSRFEVSDGKQRLIGLPAFLVALCSRWRIGLPFALLLMPLAVLAESGRSSLFAPAKPC